MLKKNPIKWPGYSKDTVRLNIADLMREGRSQKQAIAIAIHNARQAYRHKYPTRAWPHWLKPMVKVNPATTRKQVTVYTRSKRVALAEAVKRGINAPVAVKVQGGYVVYQAYAPGVKKNPASTQKEAAAELFEKFTGHKGAVVKTIEIPELPKAVAVIGKIDGILYETVRDGVQERYKHTFKKHARPLFCVSHDGRQIVLIGGSYDFTARGIVDRTK